MGYFHFQQFGPPHHARRRRLTRHLHHLPLKNLAKPRHHRHHQQM